MDGMGSMDSGRSERHGMATAEKEAASVAAVTPGNARGGTLAFDDDWEEYDPKSGLTFTHHMIAGSCAGLMEHVFMYPVDTLKVRSPPSCHRVRVSRHPHDLRGAVVDACQRASQPDSLASTARVA